MFKELRETMSKEKYSNSVWSNKEHQYKGNWKKKSINFGIKKYNKWNKYYLEVLSNKSELAGEKNQWTWRKVNRYIIQISKVGEKRKKNKQSLGDLLETIKCINIGLMRPQKKNQEKTEKY